MKQKKLPSGVTQLPVEFQTRTESNRKAKGLKHGFDNVYLFPFDNLSKKKQAKYGPLEWYPYMALLVSPLCRLEGLNVGSGFEFGEPRG